MSNWITVCEFPLQQDLSALAAFIQRHQLPLRISEENNRQRVASLAPQLVQPMQQLLERWQAGEVDLSQLTVHVYEESPAQSQQEDCASAETEITAGAYVEEKTPETSAAGEAGREMPHSVIPQWPLRKTPVCLLLIALCFLGWFFQRWGLDSGMIISPQIAGDFSVSDSSLMKHMEAGEFWRLWTPAIIHFSLPHALFNSLGVWIIGRSMEARAGSLLFALLVLLVAPFANFLQFMWSPEIKFGGMSGVVYGLVGTAFVIQKWQPSWNDVPRSMLWLMITWLVLCAIGVIEKIFSVGIANAAHIGGFAAGLVLGVLFCVVGGGRRYFAGQTADATETGRISKTF